MVETADNDITCKIVDPEDDEKKKQPKKPKKYPPGPGVVVVASTPNNINRIFRDPYGLLVKEYPKFMEPQPESVKQIVEKDLPMKSTMIEMFLREESQLLSQELMWVHSS